MNIRSRQKDQMSSAYVTISGGGSYRNLDSDDPGSFTVKYDEAKTNNCSQT